MDVLIAQKVNISYERQNHLELSIQQLMKQSSLSILISFQLAASNQWTSWSEVSNETNSQQTSRKAHLLISQLMAKLLEWEPELTRTTRTPAFWDTPDAPWLPILVIAISSHVKIRLSQIYKFWKLPKIQIMKFCKKNLHATHFLKLLDKMYKYEMDPTRTVGATERTRDAGRMDGQTDGRTDGVKPIYPPTTSLFRGIISWHFINLILNAAVWLLI